MKKVKTIVLMPIGPTCQPEFIADSIESAFFYLDPSTKVVLVDDSMKETGKEIQGKFSNIDLISVQGGVRGRPNHGLLAGLYLTLSKGLKHAFDNYQFQVLLRMDTDALVIGPSPDDDAIAEFARDPKLGLIGSFRVDCRGNLRGYGPTIDTLNKSLRLKELIQHPRSRFPGWFYWKSFYSKAIKNGYQPGDQCQGGAYFMSYECVKRLYKMDLLERYDLQWINLHGDQIFGLLTYVTGLKLGDFVTGDYPMGIKHQGLPWHPDELIKRRKKITHSTRFFESLDEREIRKIFCLKRIKITETVSQKEINGEKSNFS